MQREITHFFRAPAEDPVESGIESTLYLLRREVQDCLVGEVVPEHRLLSHPTRRRLFATALVVFSGIDLLAKFAAGPTMGARDAFVSFLVRFCRNDQSPMDPEQAEIVWSFRSALVHSFGLHHVDRAGNVIPLWIFQQDSPAPVVAARHLLGGGVGWELSIDELVGMFLDGVAAFREAVESDAELQGPFLVAYHRYGTSIIKGHISLDE